MNLTVFPATQQAQLSPPSGKEPTHSTPTMGLRWLRSYALGPLLCTSGHTATTSNMAPPNNSDEPSTDPSGGAACSSQADNLCWPHQEPARCPTSPHPVPHAWLCHPPVESPWCLHRQGQVLQHRPWYHCHYPRSRRWIVMWWISMHMLLMWMIHQVRTKRCRKRLKELKRKQGCNKPRKEPGEIHAREDEEDEDDTEGIKKKEEVLRSCCEWA